MNTSKSADSFCEVYMVPVDTYNKIIANISTNDRNDILNINKKSCSENPSSDPVILNSTCDKLSDNTSDTPSNQLSNNAGNSISNILNNNLNSDNSIASYETPRNDLTIDEFNPDPRRASTPIPSDMSIINNSNIENTRPLLEDSLPPTPASRSANISSYASIPNDTIANNTNPGL